MAGELAGQVALVTGGGSGIGRAIALAFARAGAAVMLTACTASELEETAALIATEGGRAAALPADVTDRGAMEALLAETDSRLGPVGVLVNDAGAGTGGAGPYETLSWDAIAMRRSVLGSTRK